MSINKVILLGYTGKDPEVKDVAGTKVANLSLATTEKGYTLQNGIQVPDRTEWHSLIFWKGLAEVVESMSGRVLKSISRARSRPGSMRIERDQSGM